MKKTVSQCCGGFVHRSVKEVNKMPANPKVASGVKVIYLGAGYTKLKGKGTGLSYHASDHQRQFKVHTEDLESVLLYPHMILQP